MRATMTAAAAVLLGLTTLALHAENKKPQPPAATQAATKPRQPIDQPFPKDAENWRELHKTYVEKASKGSVDLYFVGDSITARWSGAGQKVWQKEFAGWKPGNFGIGGDGTQHVLWRLDNGELEGVKPKVFVVMIGTNNIGRYNSNDDIIRANAAIIKKLEATNPDAHILLLGIFPRGKSASDPYRARIKDINAGLAKIQGKNLKYMDIGDKFLAADGSISADIMPDEVHPGEKGYQVWADAIKPTLTEWLGAPAK